MKKFLLAAAVLFFACTSVLAQPKDEWQVFKETFHKEKKDIVNEYMKLSPDQAAKFWPLYEEYNKTRGEIAKDRIGVIGDYGAQLSTLTDAQADDLAKRLFKNDKNLAKLDEKYYKKFSKAVGGVKAAQYLQMEQYFTTSVRSTIQENIPFIGEIDRATGH
jgi:hypothetical protein